jgi:hypothetical protein
MGTGARAKSVDARGRTRWSIYRECMHNPCACNGPLVWDEAEKAYYCLFLSCHGMTKKNTWLTKLLGAMAAINYNCGEKKRKDRMEKEKRRMTVPRTITDTVDTTCKGSKERKQGTERANEKEKGKVKQLEHKPDHCLHCDEDPCVFIQIEIWLCENDDTYFTETIMRRLLWPTIVLNTSLLSSMLR